MKKIGYIIAVIALTISGYFLIKTYATNTKKSKFISDIESGRKPFDEANWMSSLSVRENDRARLIKDTVIEVMSGKEIALAELLDTSNVFLHYGNINNSTEIARYSAVLSKIQG